MTNEARKSEVFAFVPSYNHAPFVEKCLRSIIAQTHAPAKLLVIDDGSKDDSPRIIERVLKDAPFDAELVVRPNRGLCATLNEGFAASFGDYFAYIGSDDWWLPAFFEARVALMETHPKAVIGYGHAYMVDADDRVFDCTDKYTHDWGNYPDGDAREMLLKGIAPISSTIFYRRDALAQTRWNENSRLEDYEMYLQMMNLGEFAFDPQVLSVWRQHGYNTSKNLGLMLDEVIEAQERNFDALGVDRAGLESIRTRTKFRYARDFLQHGQKRRALELARESWRGANSNLELAKFALRMFVPMKVVEMKRKF